MSEQVKKYKKYKKPPIVEAVIEVRFVKPLEERQIEKLVSKMKSEFTIQSVRVSVEEISGLQAEAKTRLAGYKLVNNADSAIIVQIKQDAISISRLPPYEGWPNLLAEFKKYYDWYTNKNFKTLSRIGVRYINRIDIPWMDGNIKLEHYFKIYPHTPKKNFPALISFSIQSVTAIDNDQVLTINVHESDDTPLLKHGSFVFDLDVAQSKNLPINNTQLFEMLDEIRDKKNFFFEDLLTPKCKRLFN